MLTAVGVVWTTWIGWRIWVTPVRYHVIRDFTDSAGNDQRVEGYSFKHFSDVSNLGAVPLIIPVAMAAGLAWCAWQRRWTAALAISLLFFLYCFVGGFSIGGAYWRPGLVLLVAAVFVTIATRLQVKSPAA